MAPFFRRQKKDGSAATSSSHAQNGHEDAGPSVHTPSSLSELMSELTSGVARLKKSAAVYSFSTSVPLTTITPSSESSAREAFPSQVLTFVTASSPFTV